MASIWQPKQSRLRYFFKQLMQKITITCSLFIKNDLFTHAGSASFSLFLSAVPIIMMIVIITTRLLNNSEMTLETLITYFPVIAEYVNAELIDLRFLSVKKIGMFEIVIGFSILWAARKLFYSVQAGLSVIHRTQETRTVIIRNIIPILCELIIVAVYAACIVVTSTANSLLKSGIADAFLPAKLLVSSRFITRFLPLFLLFFFCFVSYKTVPKIKIKNRHAFLSAFCCTLSFYTVQSIFFKFVNTTKYNLIYGFMSNLIITMIVVYIFFQLFLFFAQYNFVFYYFDILLLSRIYLLPPVTDLSLMASVLRLLYLKPYRLYTKYAIHYEPGDPIFLRNENPDNVYYVYYGVAEEIGITAKSKLYIRGEILGETDLILHRPRVTQARALTATILLKIPAGIFNRMLSADIQASLKTADTLKQYIQTNESNQKD